MATQLRKGQVQSTVLGYVEITSDFTGATNTNVQDITGLSVDVTVPVGGRPIKITLHAPRSGTNSSAGNDLIHYIREGSTTLISSLSNIPAANYDMTCISIYYGTPSAGAHTYKASISNAGAGRPIFRANSTLKGFLLVELL